MSLSTRAEPRPRVFCSWSYPESGLRLLREHCEVEVWDDEFPAPPEETHRRISDGIDGVFAMPPTDRLDANILASAPGLRAITGFGVGFDYVDIEAATKYGIAVTNTPGVLVDTTAELAFGLILAASRRLAEADRYIRSRTWEKYDPALLWGRDLFGATLGIVGMGAIGQSVARRAVAFGMDVIYTGRTRKLDAEGRWGARYGSLTEILSQADIVSVHCALTEETNGLIGPTELHLMKKDAILVNTARGPIVDQHALAEALADGRLASAGLDVFEEEPLHPDDPLLALSNVVLAPHIGSATHGTRARMAELAAEGLLDTLKGRRPTHLVNPEVMS